MRGERGVGSSWRQDPDHELEQELTFHVEGRAEELARQGLAPEEARRRALTEFGDLEAARRYCLRQDRRRLRRRRVVEAMAAARDDATAALRATLRRPGAIAAPAAILAMGVALNMLVFTVVQGVLLAPLPFLGPDRVHVLEEQATTGGMSRASYPVLDAWRRNAAAVEAVAAYLENDFVAALGGAPRHVPGAGVTEGFFGLLERPVLLGRAFEPHDHVVGAPRTILVSEGLWKQAWGGDPGVLEQMVRLHGEPYRVVGVVRDGAAFPEAARLWLPVEAAMPELANIAGAKILVALARLRPGVDAASTSRELAEISAGVDGGAPQVSVTPLADRLLGDVRTPLLLLQGAVLLVLLAACANAGGMLLARSVRRRAELALRASLGAGAGRLGRTLLGEGLLLGAASGLAGLAVAAVLLRPALALLPPGVPRVATVELDPGLAGAGLALAAATGVITALLPALSGARTPPAILLRESSGATGEPPWLRRLLEGMVVGQVAVAMVLTVGAGLLVRSFMATVAEDPGFDPARVTVLDVSLPETRYPDRAARAVFARTLLERAAFLPGAEAVAVARNLPISGSSMTSPLLVEGSAGTTGAVQVAAVSAGYFDVLRIPLLDGEGFGSEDTEGGPATLVVDASLQRPEGRSFSLDDRAHSFFGAQEMRRIVGIAGPVRHAGLRLAPTPVVYEPFFQAGAQSGFTLLVRSSASPPVVAASAAALVRDLDPELAADRVATLASRLSRSVAAPRFFAVGLSVFGLLAGILALAGCQAGLAHRVAARRRELGLRLALGATRASVRLMVVRRGVALVGTGAVLGVAVALPATRFLESQLYGVVPWDPISYLAALVLLVAAGAWTADSQARRAGRVDPVETLRSAPG